MEAKELAAMLTGAEYGNEITTDQEDRAAAAGLVVVFGASDNLMEVRGAIYDEAGAWEGDEFQIDAHGLLPSWEQVDHDDLDEMRAYFKREGHGAKIAAIWHRDGYSWLYETAIPHETFEVVENGEPYCRGIVFRLSDADPTHPLPALTPTHPSPAPKPR